MSSHIQASFGGCRCTSVLAVDGRLLCYLTIAGFVMERWGGSFDRICRDRCHAFSILDEIELSCPSWQLHLVSVDCVADSWALVPMLGKYHELIVLDKMFARISRKIVWKPLFHFDDI